MVAGGRRRGSPGSDTFDESSGIRPAAAAGGPVRWDQARVSGRKLSITTRRSFWLAAHLAGAARHWMR